MHRVRVSFSRPKARTVSCELSIPRALTMEESFKLMAALNTVEVYLPGIKISVEEVGDE